jgi:uncharacterized protein (TIGR03083 family)
VTLPATGSDLLRQAVEYALASGDMVTPPQLAQPTPCPAWTLGMLLSHLSDSLDALTEGLVRGRVDVLPSASTGLAAEPFGMRLRCATLLAVLPAGPPAVGPSAAGGSAAGPSADGPSAVGSSAVGSSAAGPSDRVIAIGDCGLPDNVLACTGAIEVAVHGWDISAACGRPQPIPATLASALLDAARVLLPGNARVGLFAPERPAPPAATPGDCLLAYLGRQCFRLTPEPGS